MNNFICKAKCIKTGKWIQGYYLAKTDPLYNITYHNIVYQQRDKHGILDSLTTWWPIDPDTLCRYTGVNDQRGKPIFEHDLVRTEFGRICEVVWVTYPSYVGWDLIPVAQFDSPPPTKTSLFLSRNLEVIDNIFDQEMQYNE